MGVSARSHGSIFKIEFKIVCTYKINVAPKIQRTFTYLPTYLPTYTAANECFCKSCFKTMFFFAY